jgi:hypothetical protein
MGSRGGPGSGESGQRRQKIRRPRVQKEGGRGVSEDRTCPVCGTANPGHARFCKRDGTRLEPERVEASAPVAAGLASAAEGETPAHPLGVAAAGRAGRPPAAVRALFAPAAAVVLAPIVVFSVAAAASPDSALRELLLPERSPVPGWIPGAIVFLALWVLLDLAVRAVGLARELAGLREGQELDLVEVCETLGYGSARARLGAARRARRSALGRRVGALLGDLAEGIDPARALAHSVQASGLEAAAAASGHRVERRLAVSMALLGGVGTAAAGVAGAPTLALGPTLLGLAGALVALLASAAVEAQGEALRGSVDALALEIVRRAPPGPADRAAAR